MIISLADIFLTLSAFSYVFVVAHLQTTPQMAKRIIALVKCLEAIVFTFYVSFVSLQEISGRQVLGLGLYRAGQITSQFENECECLPSSLIFISQPSLNRYLVVARLPLLSRGHSGVR